MISFFRMIYVTKFGRNDMVFGSWHLLFGDGVSKERIMQEWS